MQGQQEEWPARAAGIEALALLLQGWQEGWPVDGEGDVCCLALLHFYCEYNFP